MSHLKDQLSALIDGELSGSELDRAHAHLAACAQCRAEAAALRDLKRELRNLAAEQPSEDLSRRLLAMATPDDAAPPPEGVGVSTTRRGEDVIKEEGSEAGREETGSDESPSGRPAGESSPRDATAVKSPDHPDSAAPQSP